MKAIKNFGYFLMGWLLLAAAMLYTASAHATGVAVVGLFPGKALVSISGGAPRVLNVGASIDGVTLVAVSDNQVTVRENGALETLGMGAGYAAPESVAATAPSTAAARHYGDFDTVTIPGDNGSYWTDASVNGQSVRMIVDTGASITTISQAEADSMGIDYRNGYQETFFTANGKTKGWVTTVDSITVGPIEVDNVQVAVLKSSPNLLGMTFLQRVDMKRTSDGMVLTRHY